MIEDDLAALYRELGRLGLVVGSSGNVSARIEEGMAITATGVAAQTAGSGQIVRMGLQGVQAGALAPSSEWEMHAAIYRTAPAAQVIVHTHSDAAVALSCLGGGLPAFHYMVAAFGGPEVRCAPYALFGSAELAGLAAAAIAGRSACLLGNHGMICHGRDGRSALATAVLLETLARQYLLARSAGAPRMLSAVEMDAALLRYRSYGQQGGVS